ncbi:unnamed protein product [Phytophthora lilii]|uniref:RxLR effector protein n=1 Tax=Phytophthora lilii TaxID=2077276 RepID=A0A9W6X7A9_9STRA|nr:unnamed protein product [Phytophthora lilii]
MNMRLTFMIMLIATTLLISGGAVSAAIDWAPLATNGEKSAKIYLRIESTVKEAAEEGDEERAPSVKSSVILRLNSLFKVTSASQLTDQAKLAKQFQYLDKSFTNLKLHEAGPGLFTNPKLMKWLKIKQRFNKKNGLDDTSGIAIFLKYFKDEDLSALIERARKSSDSKTKDFANQLRGGELLVWLENRVDPKIVFKRLNVAGSKDGVNRGLYREYLIRFNKKYVNVPAQ